MRARVAGGGGGRGGWRDVPEYSVGSFSEEEGDMTPDERRYDDTSACSHSSFIMISPWVHSFCSR